VSEFHHTRVPGGKMILNTNPFGSGRPNTLMLIGDDGVDCKCLAAGFFLIGLHYIMSSNRKSFPLIIIQS